MKQQLLKSLRLRVTMLVAMLCGLLGGASQAWGAEGDEITSVENIVDGQSYYIKGVRNVSGTAKTYYLKFTDSKGSQSGTEASEKSEAQLITFLKQTDGTYYLKTATGNYIAPGTSNGKINVSESGISVTASNQTSKIRLSITNSGTTWSIQKNTSAANFGGYKNTQTDITLVEGPSGSTPSLETSDLSITNAPVALSFDLYNNSAAQIVNFTTSSTGAVTVSESEYVTTSVSGNTISVTPVKVTPSAQTITISQAADENYAAGTATFTVSIDDSTPAGDYKWVETNLSELTTSDIFVIVGNNGSNFAMSNDNGTSSAPTAVAVTVADGKITSNVATTIQWTVSGNATDGYTFYPNGSTSTWLYCTNGNNGVRVGTNESKTFKIDQGYLKHAGTSRYVGVYNSSDWRCYTSNDGNIENQTFKFYKRVDASTPDTPILNADDVNLAYDATSGSIVYTITNPVEGKTLFAESSESWLNLGTPADGTIALTFTANSETTERTATVTLTYGDITKDVQVTQSAAPLIYSTIPALFAAATSTSTPVNVTFGNWVVTGVNYSQVFVTDGTNGFIIYQSGHGFEVGNTLSGTASCNLFLYNGSAELTGLTSTSEGLTVGTGGNVTPVATNIAALSAVNTGSIVTLSNLTYDGSVLTDGTNTVKPMTTLYSDASFEDNKKYNVTGVFLVNDSEKRILPRSASDIEELAVPKHIVKFFVNGEEQTDAQAEISEGAEITFPTPETTIEGKTFVGWTTSAIDDVTETAPAVLVRTAIMGNADVTYYAVYATQEGEDSSSSATLTAVKQDDTSYSNNTFTDNQNNTWTGYCAPQNQSGTYFYNIRNKANEDSYILSPNFDGNITSITIVGWNASSTEDKTLSIISPDGESTYGTIIVPKSSKPSNELTATLDDSEFTQFKFKASESIGIVSVTVNCGTPATYSGYCTTVATPEAYAVVSTDGTSVTFYYDGNKATREGTKYDITDGSTHEWVDNNNSTLTTATFDPSFSRYSGLTTLSRWFFECQQLQTITGLEHLNTENVTDMYQLFRYCQKLKSLDLSNFNTGKVTRMIEMFGFCTGLENITLGANFSTENVVYMQSMFTNCMKLMSVDVSGFNTEKVTNMSGMFWDCEAMTSIDVSSFNTANVTNMSSMFGECGKLVTIYVGDNWNTEKVSSINSANMFTASTKIVGGNGTTYNYNYTSKTYGRIDGNGGAGYLSHKTKKYVTVGSAGYTTFVPTANVSLAEGVEAYGVDEIKESSMHLLPIETAVPSGEAVVIKAAEGVHALPIVESATAVSGNLLQASDGNVQGGDNIFVLANKSQGVGFYPTASTINIPAGKAYLNTSASSVKEFLAFDFGGADGVEAIDNVTMNNAKVYNIAGQRVKHLNKGIYVVRGKKILVK